MVSPPCSDRLARLEALRRLAILDTSPEEPYDDIVRVATTLLDVPLGAVSLFDDRRQWFKASCGIGVSELSLDVSLCTQTLDSGRTSVVQNAERDVRYAANPLVCQEPRIRFYAGVPIYAEDIAVGTLCVADHRPRRISDAQVEGLEALARQVGTLLTLRIANRRLAHSEARFEAFMKHAPFAAYIKDESGRYLYMSPYGNQTQGVVDMANTTDSGWMDEHTLAALRRHEAEVLTSGCAIARDFTITHPDGTLLDWSVVKFPFADPQGERLLGAIAADVTPQKEAERLLVRHLEESRHYATRLKDANERLERLATTDGLTGLLNRRAFLPEFADRLGQGTHALILLDVDDFKSYNDTYGHPAGDAILMTVARHLMACPGVAARLGGEEFAVIVPCDRSTDALAFAEKLRLSIENHAWCDRPVTVSMGFAVSEPGDSTDAMIVRADRALYRAKASGRNRVCQS